MSGLDLAKTVGLKICKCQATFEPVTCEISLNDLTKILQTKFKNRPAVFVAWQVQSIVWGTYNGGELYLRDKTFSSLKIGLSAEFLMKLKSCI